MPSLPFWARIETLWLLFVPLCAVIYALLQPLAPNDLWYHVRAGELAVLSGHLPATNAMSTGVPLDKPFYYQSWLAEITLYETLTHFGLAALQWLRALCLCVAFVFTISSGLRWAKRENLAPGASARAVAAGSLWAFLLLSNNIDLRPQTFSVVLCAVWVWLLLDFWRTQSWGRGVSLCIVSAIWANTHGAFIIAPASLVVLSGAQLFFGRAKALWAASGAVALVTLVNPHGWHLYQYLANLSNDTISQKYIQEWRSPGFNEWHSILFWVSPLLIAILWRMSKPPKSCLPWLAPVALTWIMGTRDQRAMIWFALFAAPLLGLLLSFLMPTPKPQSVPRAAQLINGVLLLFLGMSPLAFSPELKTELPWPDAFRNQFAPTPQSVFPGAPNLLLERTTPSSAVEWWHKNSEKAGAKVWTDMVPGSFLTWATRPERSGKKAILPLCDPRIELFPAPFWENYVRLSAGPRGAGNELLKQGFTQALLDTETQAGLVRELKKERWTIAARNGSTVLFLAPNSSIG
ncbi:hypothetical protein IAD21_03261 [Abditibacteriota bacterium]|nr:hypothetical protein IAD21_03261 [Abditibacteriota bacterium]